MLIPRDICYTRQETSDEVHQREYSTLVRGSCPLNPQKKSASTAQTATNVSRIAHNRSMSSSNVTQALIGGCPFEWAQTQLSVRVRVAGRALPMAEVSGINARSSYPERTPELRRRLGCPRRFMQQFVE